MCFNGQLLSKANLCNQRTLQAGTAIFTRNSRSAPRFDFTSSYLSHIQQHMIRYGINGINRRREAVKTDSPSM